MIRQVGKYHFYLVSDSKIGNIAFDNNYSDALAGAKAYIKSKSDKIDKFQLVKVKLSKVSKKILQDDKKSKIKTIGGPIKIDLVFYDIKNKKIKSRKTSSGTHKNVTVFISDKYILTYGRIKKETIKDIINTAQLGKWSNNLFKINSVDNIEKY